jgi:pilus assembly protein Flp/PilA
MKGVTKNVRRFIQEENGPTATEYAVMLALIIVVALLAIGALGSKVNTMFTNIETAIPTGSSS